ncbi:sigma-70 family RNA polymerase sigma factor [candidate division KSB1 bacterium]|nr:sigma-70 family RNA polymerase sigma factor [candidate division KSB1 bacterium]
MSPHRDDQAKEWRAAAVRQLILDYQDGNQRAFNRLMDEYKYWEYIFKALCAKGVASAQAEDYTQQICIRLMEGLKKFRFDCPFESYLNLIVKRQAINHYRRGVQTANGEKFKLQFISLDEPAVTEETETTPIDRVPNPAAALPDANLLLQELRRVVGACLRLFTNKTIKLITCLWLSGFKQRQTAALLQISTSAVGGNLHRGQKMLRDCVKKKYF